MQMPGILLRNRGDPHHVPHAALALHIARQQAQETGETRPSVFAWRARRFTSMLDESTT